MQTSPLNRTESRISSPTTRRQRRLSILLPRPSQAPYIMTGNRRTDHNLLEQEGYTETSKYLLIEGEKIQDAHFRIEQVVDSLAQCNIPHRLKFGECSPQAIRFILHVLLEKNIQVQCLDLSGCLLNDGDTMDVFLRFVTLNSTSMKTLIIAKNILLEHHLNHLIQNGSFPFLNHLKIKGCAQDPTRGVQLVETTIRMLGLQRQLVELNLAKNYVPLDAMEAIIINCTGSNLERLNLSENPIKHERHLDWGILSSFLDETTSLESLNFNFTQIGKYTFLHLLKYAIEQRPLVPLTFLLARTFSSALHQKIELTDLGEPQNLRPFNVSVILSIQDISRSFQMYLMKLIIDSPLYIQDSKFSLIESLRISKFASNSQLISSEDRISAESPLIFNFWLTSINLQTPPFPRLKKVVITSMQLTSCVLEGLRLLLEKSPRLLSLNLSQNNFTVTDMEKILRFASGSNSLQVLNLSQNMREGVIIMLPAFSNRFKELVLESKFINIDALLLRKNKQWSHPHIARKVLLEQELIEGNKQNLSQEALKAIRMILISEERSPFTQTELQNLKVIIFENSELEDYHNKMLNLLSRQRSLKFLLIPFMHLRNNAISLILSKVSQCPLKCIDLTGNQMGGTGFQQVILNLPIVIDKLSLAFNKLKNQNLRDLASKVTIVKILDIRGNDLTINVAKNFPLLEVKRQELGGEYEFIIYHSLVWKFSLTFQQDSRCRKLKERFYQFSMTYKYHPLAVKKIEKSPQFCLTLELMMWFLNFIFYCMILSLPLAMTVEPQGDEDQSACQQGHQWLAHGIITVLFIVMGVFELIVLLKLRRRLKDRPELFGLKKFSIFWKLGSSALARIDIYTDICFIAILRDCRFAYQTQKYNYGTLEIICTISVILSLIFPVIFQINLIAQAACKKCRHNSVAFPRMERIARLAYSSEYKGIAAIIGSFCVDLKIRICKHERSVPRLLSLYRLFLEDLIQAACQLIFTVISGASNIFVLISILITVVSVFVSFANVFITTGAKPSRQLLTEIYKPRQPPSYISALVQNQNSSASEEDMNFSNLHSPEFRARRYRVPESLEQSAVHDRHSTSNLISSFQQADTH